MDREDYKRQNNINNNIFTQGGGLVENAALRIRS